MPYRPFPIADPSFGLLRDREPWIAPANAFRKLENAQIFRGRMEKRRGSKRFGDLAKQVASEALNGSGTLWVAMLDNRWVINPTLDAPKITVQDSSGTPQVITFDITEYSPSQQFHPDAREWVQQDDGTSDGVGVVSLGMGYVIVVFDASATAPVTITYTYAPHQQANIVKTGVVVGNFPTDFWDSGDDTPTFQFPDQNLYLDDVLYRFEVRVEASDGDIVVRNDPTDVTWNDAVGNLVKFSGLRSAGGIVYPRSGVLTLWASLHANTKGARVVVDYEIMQRDPCVALRTLVTETGAEELLALSHRDIYRYSTASKSFIFVDTAFANLGANDSIRADTIQQESDKASVLAIVAETNRAKKYNLTGVTFTNVPNSITDLSTPPVEVATLDGAKIILAHQGYVLYLATKETHGVDPQQDFLRRIRWARPLTHETLLENDFVDVPTQEVIRAAEILNKEIYVFTDTEVHRLKFKDDFRAPWVPQIVSGGEGAVAKNGIEVLDRSIVVFSKTGPREFDGREMRRLGDVLGDIILDIDPNNADKIQSVRSRELRQFWLAYPQVGQTLPNRIVVVSEENGSYALWDSPGWRCFGKYSKQGTLLVDEITEIVDTIDWPVDSQVFVAGFPIILAGKHDGEIHEVPGLVYGDDGAAINFELETQGLNPFLQGNDPRTARLGFVQFFGDAVPGEALTVSFFRDSDKLAYVTHTLALEPKISGEDKFWASIDVGTIAYQHRINLKNVGTRKIAIDAIVPWFAAGGRIDHL